MLAYVNKKSRCFWRGITCDVHNTLQMYVFVILFRPFFFFLLQKLKELNQFVITILLLFCEANESHITPFAIEIELQRKKKTNETKRFYFICFSPRNCSMRCR